MAALSPVGGTKSCSQRNQVSVASTRTPASPAAIIIQQVEQSLRRLRTDRIDLYYAHFPDPTTPLEQTLTVYDDLIRQGKLRYVALSNDPAWQVTEALWIADDRRLVSAPVCAQVKYNLLDRTAETELAAACVRFGLSIVPYAPLHGGLLADLAVLDRDIAGDKRYGGPGFTEAEIAVARELDRLAREWNLGMQQVSLAWLLSRPAVASVIVGAETTEELAANALAADVELTTEQLEAVSALTGATTASESRASPARPGARHVSTFFPLALAPSAGRITIYSCGYSVAGDEPGVGFCSGGRRSGPARSSPSPTGSPPTSESTSTTVPSIRTSPQPISVAPSRGDHGRREPASLTPRVAAPPSSRFFACFSTRTGTKSRIGLSVNARYSTVTAPSIAARVAEGNCLVRRSITTSSSRCSSGVCIAGVSSHNGEWST